jgi:hypothetical protein
VFSAAPPCNQFSAEGSLPPVNLLNVFSPSSPVTPFYQWDSNNGYCCEVCLIQAGLANGQWISQYNARSTATPFTTNTQTGKSKNGINFLSQMLFDDFAPTGTTGANSFGNAAANLKLSATSYPSETQSSGTSGYQNFLQWIKTKVIDGDNVAVGIVNTFGNGPYSHAVTVLRIESNYPLNDTAYHGDDVIYFEDHGVYTLVNSTFGSPPTNNPSIPPGAGTSSECTPYIFGYEFQDLSAAPTNTKRFQIPVPGNQAKSKNYAFAVSGPLDTQQVTLPLYLTFTTSSPLDPIAGYQYENPYIGDSDDGNAITNIPPTAFSLQLTVHISGLTPGNTYNLYRYNTSVRPLLGPLSVPTSDFNSAASQALASSITPFTATATTFTTTYNALSSDTVVFRCVSTISKRSES